MANFLSEATIDALNERAQNLAAFDPDSTRPTYEQMALKMLSHLGTEKEVREDYLKRNPHYQDDYLDPDVQAEWQGWKRGVMHGYELWGIK